MCQNCDKNLPQKNSDKNIIHLPDLLRNTMPYFVSNGYKKFLYPICFIILSKSLFVVGNKSIVK